MKKLLINTFSVFFIFPLFACQKTQMKKNDIDNMTYINNFELVQENSSKDTRIKIKSPKAIINPTNNDIEIFDSSIEIIKANGKSFQISSNNSTLNNYNNLIRAYDMVYVSLLDNTNSFIKTNSLDWDLNSSNINFNSPLHINFKNTTINSSDGIYNIDSGQLKIYNNIFNRSIFNKNGETLYKIRIIADLAKWLKDNNSLEFTSNNKQVETTIDFLGIK